MNDDSLFSETEEELFNKIKKVYDSINRNLNEAGIKDDSISAFSIDDTISLSDDGLSDISDVSSVASFKFSNVNKKKYEFHTPQIDKQKHRKSKIPVFDLQRKNRQNMAQNFNNKKISKNTHSTTRNVDNSHAAPKKNQFNDKKKMITKKIEQDTNNNNIQNPIQNFNNQNNNNRINIYNYQEPIKPKNFLIPDLTIYSRVCACIFEGRDFPLPSPGRGERSTYAVIQLHPDILPIQSPISFNKTKKAIYNGGFDINCSGLDFTSVTPIVSVYDYISEKERELIGVAFIELHLAKQFNNDMCIFMIDEWLDIFALNNRVKTGRVKITLIFHTNEKDVSSFIKKKSSIEKVESKKKPNITSKSASSDSDDDEKPIIKNEIIIGEDYDDDVDFIVDDDETVKKANEKLKNEDKMKRNYSKNKSKKEAKFESLGIQAEPEFQDKFMNDFHDLSLTPSFSSLPIKESKAKNPFNFNTNHKQNGIINSNNINGKNNDNQNFDSKDQITNSIQVNKANQMNSYSKYIQDTKRKNDKNQNSRIFDVNNNGLNSYSSENENDDDNKFEFTLGHPSFEKNEIDPNKNETSIVYNGESLIDSDSSIPQKVPFSNNNENEIFDILDEKQLKFIDESMLATMSSVLSNDENIERSSLLEDDIDNVDVDNNNDVCIKKKENEKPNKRYTSYADFHFMEEME